MQDSIVRGRLQRVFREDSCSRKSLWENAQTRITRTINRVIVNRGVVSRSGISFERAVEKLLKCSFSSYKEAIIEASLRGDAKALETHETITNLVYKRYCIVPKGEGK